MCVGSRNLYFNESSNDVFYLVGVSWVVGEAYSFIGPRLSNWPARSLPVLIAPSAECPAWGAVSDGSWGRWSLHLAERLSRSWPKNGEEKKRLAHSPESMTPGGQVTPCGWIKGSECVHGEAAGGLWGSGLGMPRGVSGKRHIWQMDWKGEGKERLPLRAVPAVQPPLPGHAGLPETASRTLRSGSTLQSSLPLRQSHLCNHSHPLWSQWQDPVRNSAARHIDQNQGQGSSLVAQWVRLRAPNAGDWGSTPGQGTRSHMLQLRPRAAK